MAKRGLEHLRLGVDAGPDVLAHEIGSVLRQDLVEQNRGVTD